MSDNNKEVVQDVAKDTKADTPKVDAKTNSKDVKITLLCDVLHKDKKLTKWETLKVSKEELECFHQSFYELS